MPNSGTKDYLRGFAGMDNVDKWFRHQAKINVSVSHRFALVYPRGVQLLEVLGFTLG